MPIKDTFSYSARWDSVGIDCSNCCHFSGPAKWPDQKRISNCRLHRISLAIELGDNGCKNWEWFCKDFEDTSVLDKSAFPSAVAHFKLIRSKLQPNILYRLYGEDGNLAEYPFEQIQE